MSAFDPFGIGKAALGVWRAYLEQPGSFADAQQRFTSDWFELASRTIARLGGETVEPVARPARSDRRFADPAWTDNPFLDATKQAYLIATESIVGAIEGAPDVDAATKERTAFFARQFCDALSPSNLAWVNPAVVAETVRTGGQNLVRGMQNLLTDMRENDGRVELVDKKAFSIGKNVATTPGKVVYRNELIELIQYEPTTERVHEIPLVIVPPWINKYYILDLQPANSLVKFTTDQGFTTFVISWRNPNRDHRLLSMEDYITLGAEAAVRVAGEICGTPTANVVGYCIGGTLVAMYLAYLARTGEHPIGAVTTFASLVDFEAPGEIAHFIGANAVDFLEAQMEKEGTLAGRTMADAFNMLRANDLVWQVAVNRYLLGKDAPAFDLLFWNSDATRMPQAMHSYYLRQMYIANNLVKPDALTVRDVPLDLRRIENDWYVVASADDHIAPWRSVYQITQLAPGAKRFRLANSGHIAGIINPPGKPKANWLGFDGEDGPATASPDEWAATAPKHDGSWWNDWTAWLTARSGNDVDARVPGSTDAYPAIESAPGTYVLEK